VINAELLVDYMTRFVGFGSPRASVWFIGLEQGGGENLGELQRRLAAWVESGADAFADFPDYCARLGDSRWHGPTARVQPTLGKLVRLFLAFNGTPISTKVVREYQASAFGTRHGDTVIAELMPLPSRNVSEWIYSGIAGVPALATREAYTQQYRRLRTGLLHAAIAAAAPHVVVFVGFTALDSWAQVAGVTFKRKADAYCATAGRTEFVVVKHPTAFGAKNEYFETVGRELAVALDGRRS
jgi:hypothetical protein